MNIKEYNQAVNKLSDALYRFALQYTKEDSEAEDMVQETFITLWENLGKVNAEQVKNYVYTVIHNRITSHFRHEEIKRGYQAEAGTGAFAAETDTPEVKDLLQYALQQLPALQKEILMLRDWEGFSYKEIAGILQLSESQVMVYLFRARNKARKLLESEGVCYQPSLLTKKSRRT